MSKVWTVQNRQFCHYCKTLVTRLFVIFQNTREIAKDGKSWKRFADQAAGISRGLNAALLTLSLRHDGVSDTGVSLLNGSIFFFYRKWQSKCPSKYFFLQYLYLLTPFPRRRKPTWLWFLSPFHIWLPPSLPLISHWISAHQCTILLSVWLLPSLETRREIILEAPIERDLQTGTRRAIYTRAKCEGQVICWG